MHIWDTWYRIAPRRVCNAMLFLNLAQKEKSTDQRSFCGNSAPCHLEIHKVFLRFHGLIYHKNPRCPLTFSFLPKFGRSYFRRKAKNYGRYSK